MKKAEKERMKKKQEYWHVSYVYGARVEGGLRNVFGSTVLTVSSRLTVRHYDEMRRHLAEQANVAPEALAIISMTKLPG